MSRLFPIAVCLICGFAATVGQAEATAEISVVCAGD
jgi:hypothetical protein